MSEVAAQEEFVKLNEVLTHLIYFGNPFSSSGDVVIVISGNPGLPDFYREFSKSLHLESNLPVVVIGHAGHEVVRDDKSNILKGQEELFNLHGQIKHKIDLVESKLDKNCKLHLVGHSIGAWIILEILDQNIYIAERTKSITFLFPTTQYIAQSTNGKFLNKVVRHVHCIPMLLINLLCCLPEFIKSSLIKTFLYVSSLPKNYLDRISKYLQPQVIEKVLYMAYDEMDHVKELNVKTIEREKSKTLVIYSSNDGWAPVKFIRDFERFQPELQLMNVNCDHAFVLKSSEYVGELVSKFINNFQ